MSTKMVKIFVEVEGEERQRLIDIVEVDDVEALMADIECSIDIWLDELDEGEE